MPKVLVIDDNADHRMLVTRVLRARGYEVSVAEDGETGLQRVTEFHPDVILLDLGLPDVDGQTLAGIIRRMPGVEHTSIIAVTAWPQETARKMVEAYGCDAYISKPIQIAKFADQIAATIEKN